MKLSCLVVDDEPLARKGLIEYVKEVEFLSLAGECENAVQAATVLKEGGIDLLLLDIHMPHLSGIDFLKTLRDPPMVIFTTAFSEYALEGYELAVMDYLVKPIPFDRFLKAVNKAFDFHSIKANASNRTGGALEYFFVKSNGKYERVAFTDILYVESMQNYVIIHLASQKLIVYMTLAGMESQLPANHFLKVHKSFIVSIAKVKAIEGNDLVIGVMKIPVSRNLKEEVMKHFLGKNLFKR